MEENISRKDEGVLERILSLLDHKGITDKSFEEALNVGRGMVSHWRYDGRNSYLQYINAICEILETTPNYLFHGVERDDEIVNLSPIEKDLIQNYRNVDDELKKYILDLSNIFVKAANASKKVQ